MDKLRPLHDAIALDVEDGMSVAMSCGLESLIPFAASHEIIRQKRQDLTLICPISDMQFDQLIGAGCVKKIIASWVGNVAATQLPARGGIRHTALDRYRGAFELHHRPGAASSSYGAPLLTDANSSRK